MSVESLPAIIRRAYPIHKDAAARATKLFQSWAPNNAARIPGMDTTLRMVVRIESGCTEAEAAGREYSYRWHLCLNQWRNHAEAGSRSMPVTGAFPVPHAIGM